MFIPLDDPISIISDDGLLSGFGSLLRIITEGTAGSDLLGQLLQLFG